MVSGPFIFSVPTEIVLAEKSQCYFYANGDAFNSTVGVAVLLSSVGNTNYFEVCGDAISENSEILNNDLTSSNPDLKNHEQTPQVIRAQQIIGRVAGFLSRSMSLEHITSHGFLYFSETDKYIQAEHNDNYADPKASPYQYLNLPGDHRLPAYSTEEIDTEASTWAGLVDGYR